MYERDGGQLIRLVDGLDPAPIRAPSGSHVFEHEELELGEGPHAAAQAEHHLLRA
jgi:hypothetical protein